MDEKAPVKDSELEGLFGILRAREIALAVSGGADSSALMMLYARWLKAKGRDKPSRAPLVLTVDHQLRPEAHGEAVAVGRAATALGFQHKVLAWSGPKPKSGLQAAARTARYRLMAGELMQEARADGAMRVLVLAHTLDDQAETFLMRLARGSGVEGLAGMRETDTLEVGDGTQLTLCRPLLGLPKARLVATLEAGRMAWSEDPSNSIELFERVRIRKTLRVLGPLGLDARCIGRSAARIGRAETALSAYARELAAKAVGWHGGAYASIDLGMIEATSEAAAEMLVRLLAFVVSIMGGESPAPRLSQIERLAGQIAARSGARRAARVSLGGCLIEVKAGAANIFREAGRKGLPKVVLEPGESACWDRRFGVAADRRLTHSVTVEALGEARWARLKAANPALRRLRASARAVATLPAFTLRGQLLAAPLLAGGQFGTGSLDEALANTLVSVVFRPAGRVGSVSDV